jgi:1,4-dihydroxy-2-naphthoate octaprenyltransferase
MKAKKDHLAINPAMWRKALRVIPSVSKETWEKLDLVARWLISSRAAVLVMTFTSSAIAGLFAARDGGFRFLPWLFMTLGLVLGHASNNLFNDYTDFVRGVDKDNYYRTMYGPQPVAHGLMTTRQLLRYFGVTGGLVIACVILVFALDGWDPVILLLFAIGAAFVLLYTWPLKYIGLGEVSVLAVWGPLMIGGGYYVLTRHWSWQVVLASAPYVLGVTTVIFGKHIDKVGMDREKGIRTLPVLIGEAAARYLVVACLFAPYILIAFLIATRYFSPALAIVLLALPSLIRALPAFFSPKPETRPEGFPEGEGGWPLYFAPKAFLYTRSFGTWFLLGLVVEVALRLLAPGFWHP